MKKNMNEISGKTLNQKEMQEIKGGTSLCPKTCQITVANKGGSGYYVVNGICKLTMAGTCGCYSEEASKEGC